ncbi:MarR family transcriptional regulator [Desulfococcaceae bacterium HSG8]|nr:MarR family transcriptional regulator [Desulfococcaceae bacterium HSG8]
MTTQIQISTGDPVSTAKDFIDVWNRVESGEKVETEQHIVFENPETLFENLTPQRWNLLKTLRTDGPMTVKDLAGKMKRDKGQVRRDVIRLEQIGLLRRTADDLAEVGWDIVETRLGLAA